MEKFELLIKNEKIKSYNRISTLIIIINLALFILFAIDSKEKSIRIASLAGAAIFLMLLLLPLISAGAKTKNTIYKSVSLYVAVIVWIAMGYWWIGIICAALSFLYTVSKKPILIFFSNEKIYYSSLLMKTILWNELSNVILKDGILTLDYKNNRILQAEVENTGADVIEKEFNDFCKQRISQ